MQNFFYDRMAGDTYCVIGYEGDECEVIIPPKGFNGKDPVTLIFDRIFNGHKEIESVSIPDTVTDLGEFVFDGCENIKTVKLPDNIENIWPNAFARSGVEEITFPDSVLSIAPYTFRDCKNLRKVKCGKGMEKINGFAFCGCENLEEVILSEKTELLPNALEGCNPNVKIIVG